MVAINYQNRLVRESEREAITSVSRTQAWRLEKEGLFPKRIKLGKRSIRWKLSDLNEWLENQQGEFL